MSTPWGCQGVCDTGPSPDVPGRDGKPEQDIALAHPMCLTVLLLLCCLAEGAVDWSVQSR